MRPLAVVPLVGLLAACAAARPTAPTAGVRTWRGVPLPDAAVAIAEERDSIMLDVPGGPADVAAWSDCRWRAAGLRCQEHGQTRTGEVRLANTSDGRPFVLELRRAGEQAGHTRVAVGRSWPGR
jgi:hypothetical protein